MGSDEIEGLNGMNGWHGWHGWQGSEWDCEVEWGQGLLG